MGIIDLFVSIAIGVLAGLGIGSGGLYLVYLELFTDTPTGEIPGLNLAFFVCALAASVVFHIVRGTYREKSILYTIPVGIPAAILGTWLSGLVDPAFLRTTLGIIFLVAGFYTLLFRSMVTKKKKSGTSPYRRKTT